MSVRRLIVEVDTPSLNVTEFCAQHGVSTWFFWDLRRRYAPRATSALEPEVDGRRTIRPDRTLG